MTPSGFLPLFALISLTSSERLESILTGRPHKKTSQSPGANEGMMNSNRERKRILLVEDEEDARDLAALTLAEYKLTCARGFDEGLFAARRGYFDLYILDNWLPSGSGVEMCRLIREFDPHTPILFCSAAAYLRDIREAIRAGARDYLIKPVIPDELRQAVARLISVPPKRLLKLGGRSAPPYEKS